MSSKDYLCGTGILLWCLNKVDPLRSFYKSSSLSNDCWMDEPHAKLNLLLQRPCTDQQGEMKRCMVSSDDEREVTFVNRRGWRNSGHL